MRAAIAAVVAATLATQARAETYTYRGRPDAGAYHNGDMGYAAWIIAGPSPDLGDGRDDTGVTYPGARDWYGRPVAGWFGVRPVDDGRIPYGARIARVELHARIRARGARWQPFVHRHDNGWGDSDAWGELSWSSYPWTAMPGSAPYPWTPWLPAGVWTDMVALLPVDGLAHEWTRDALFYHCFGLWVLLLDDRSYFELSEWSLIVNTGG